MKLVSRGTAVLLILVAAVSAGVTGYRVGSVRREAVEESDPIAIELGSCAAKLAGMSVVLRACGNAVAACEAGK